MLANKVRSIDVVRRGLLPVLFAVFCACCGEGRWSKPEAYFTFGTSTLAMHTAVDSLDVVWEISNGPDEQIWYAEQSGTITRYDPETGAKRELLHISDVYRERTGGLLGMTVHPDMARHPYVFIAYVAKKTAAEAEPVSRIVRYTYADDTLRSPLVMLEYAAWSGHFGARLAIAPDGRLMIATGDGGQFDNAQNLDVPHGKILRYNIDGTIPLDNPIAGSAVWAWGLRNPQGLAFATDGQLYHAEHGDAIADEVNRVVKGKNYGWPQVEGTIDTDMEAAFARDSVIQEPLYAWTPTIAPAGVAFYASEAIPEFYNSLLLTTLKGNALHVLRLADSGDKIESDSVLFQRLFGRLRSVCVTPEGHIYVGTSNRDWNPNGFAGVRDDRIIRLSPVDRRDLKGIIPRPAALPRQRDVASRGAMLYTDYCASCHQESGRGVEGMVPSLYRATPVAVADGDSLISLALTGRGEMPAFDFLSDDDLAVVLSYVRKRFGPQASQVSTAEIGKHRK